MTATPRAKYKVSVQSSVYGTDFTKWDTPIEAAKAVRSIVRHCPKDGVRRVVKVTHKRRVIRRLEIHQDRSISA